MNNCFLKNKSLQEIARNFEVQEAVYEELGTYERLRELERLLESANNKIGVWQPMIDRLQELTGESQPLRILSQVKRWKYGVEERKYGTR